MSIEDGRRLKSKFIILAIIIASTIFGILLCNNYLFPIQLTPLWKGYIIGFFGFVIKGIFGTNFETCGIQPVLAELGYVPNERHCYIAYGIATLSGSLSVGILAELISFFWQ
ncbi:uncharacterized protein RJT21DRAFT_3680 [Scheffersomyces amazonensis]|uniref:uncharacterized protein n=1 Tax=Scheffersomyces amazonensis TaxID=1078765 RepID=UPI00315DF129